MSLTAEYGAKCPKGRISVFLVRLTHRLIELSTLTIFSVESGVFCLSLLSQNWHSVTKWLEIVERQLVWVVAKVRLRVIMLNGYSKINQSPDQNPVFTRSTWAGEPEEANQLRTNCAPGAGQARQTRQIGLCQLVRDLKFKLWIVFRFKMDSIRGCTRGLRGC